MVVINLLYIVLIALFTFPIVAKDSITWGLGHQPPRVTYDGYIKLGGQGGKQQILSEGLSPHYDANYSPMKWARFENEVLMGNNVCSSFLIKTPNAAETLNSPYLGTLTYLITSSCEVKAGKRLANRKRYH